MTDKEYKEIVAKVNKYINKWQKPMGLRWFDIKFIFSRERMPDKDAVAAMTLGDWFYRQGSITFYLPAIMDLTDSELENCVVHELCHILVLPLWDLVDENTRTQGEFAVSIMTDAFLWCNKLKK